MHAHRNQRRACVCDIGRRVRNARPVLLVVLAATAALVPIFSQELPGNPASGAGEAFQRTTDGTGDTEAVQVDEERETGRDVAESVPQWARDLRRAEIVATGTLPLTLLASRLTYSLVRFTYQSIVAGAIDPTYAPWFLAPPGSPELTTGEKLGVIGGAVTLSAVLAYVDFWLGRREAQPEP